MQIDFHHAVTYVCARLAGFGAEDADVIGHSAQYVDDATSQGEIWFDNGMFFERTASAHKTLDYRNSKALANHRVWLPFHFLPGNSGEPAPAEIPTYGKEEFLTRCICRPNSAPAQDLMRAVISRQDRPYALHRLGIASHVYLDTWAHQGFVGYEHPVNEATDLDAERDAGGDAFKEKLKGFFGAAFDEVAGRLVGGALPLGHGAVLSYPDRPYLRWSYTNGLGKRIQRDNPADFYDAVGHLYQQYRRYRDYEAQGDAVFDTEYDIPDAFPRLAVHIARITDSDGERRHAEWLRLVREGEFGFAEEIDYVGKGDGSWKHDALEMLDDLAGNTPDQPVALPASFQSSNWKLFHDALQAHRFYVLHELLPRYGLLAG
jgi:hypothetical protein